MITVARLQVVPVKGLAAVARPSLEVGPQGVAEDRRLLLLRADGSVLTLRRTPELVRVVPELNLAAGTLTVALPDGTRATSDLAAAGEPVTAHLFGIDRPGRVVPGPVADALSALAGEPLRLLLTERTGLGWDEGPVSLLSRASAAAVGTPPNQGADPDALSTGRYRMLVEVDGAAAYEEDSWVGTQLQLGSLVVRVSHPLERCVVINADPRTGVTDWRGVKSLARTRGPGSLTLGVIAQVQQPGVVRLGDEVCALTG